MYNCNQLLIFVSVLAKIGSKNIGSKTGGRIVIAPSLPPIVLQEISLLTLCYFYFFSLSYQIHSAFRIKLYIQQNKALRFQAISKTNAFNIATIIQPGKSSWVVLVIQKRLVVIGIVVILGPRILIYHPTRSGGHK